MNGVIVTGAAKRIGRAIATGLGEEGWHVFIHYLSSRNEALEVQSTIQNKGGTATVIRADLRDPDERSSLIHNAFSQCSDLLALINSASIFKYDTPKTATFESLVENFRTNTAAPFDLCQKFANIISRDGCIINMLDNKIFAPNPDYFSYTISKMAFYGVTKTLVPALYPKVRVCGIAPGITLVSGEQTQENFVGAHKLNPLRSGCTPRQIADAVKFLLKTPSINGEIITIDGGETLQPHGRDVAFVGDSKDV